MTNSHLVERISSLPPLPQTVSDIEKAYQNPEVSNKEIARIIEKDPMIVADLLKLLNSAFYGLRREISSVEQAVSLLGLGNIKDLVVNLSVRNMLRTNLDPYGLTSESFAKISQFQSMLAQELMKQINPQKADRIRLLALLQEIGKIVIADELLREEEAIPFKAELDAGWEIREIEKNYVDATTAEVSAAMLRHWDFDPLFADLIRWSDMPNQADGDYKEDAWVLKIASEAVSVRQPLSEKNRKKALNLASKAQLPKNELKKIMDKLFEKWQH
ncbi:HDOD domain-containing protein [Hydrogenimonas sp.]